MPTRLVTTLAICLLAACSASRTPDAADAGVDSGAHTADAGPGTDAGPRDASLDSEADSMDAGASTPDSCVGLRGEGAEPGPRSCTVVGVLGCDGVQTYEFAACPACPVLTPERSPVVTTCSDEGYACQYNGPGWCNFMGCDCTRDETGALVWQCWVPLC